MKIAILTIFITLFSLGCGSPKQQPLSKALNDTLEEYCEFLDAIGGSLKEDVIMVYVIKDSASNTYKVSFNNFESVTKVTSKLFRGELKMSNHMVAVIGDTHISCKGLVSPEYLDSTDRYLQNKRILIPRHDGSFPWHFIVKEDGSLERVSTE